MTCQTFTHHVGTTRGEEAIRVECAQHPTFVVDCQKRGDQSARQVAIAAQTKHEAEDPSVWDLELAPQTEGSSA